MKDDLPYFTHDNDTRNHAKMKALRARYGWTGYGQFWALNEMIAGAARACLDISRKVVRAGVACELGMTTDALEDFLSFLSNEDECGLIDYNNGVVTTERTQEDYAKTEHGRERKRAIGKNGTEKRWNGTENCQNSTENNGRIEENRIEEKREENTNTQESVLLFPEPNGATRIESARNLWNSYDLPTYRYLAISMPEEQRGWALRTLGMYSDAEVSSAIRLYAEIKKSVKHKLFPTYVSFAGFMRSGVESYCEDAQPWERCKLPPKPGEYIDPDHDEKWAKAAQRAKELERETDESEDVDVSALLGDLNQKLSKGITP